MDTLVEIGQQYKTEFEDRIEGLRQRSVTLQQQAQETIESLQPAIEAQQQTLLAAVQDMSPREGYAKAVTETFAWTAVLLFAAYFVSLISGLILAPVVSVFVGGATAFLVIYAALPAFVYKNLDFTNESDSETRFQLLGFALVQGILVGFLFSERYLSTMQPLPFLTPLIIAVGTSMAEPQVGSNRQALIGATIGGGVGAHLLIGLVLGQLSFAYFLATLLYAAAGFASLQYLLKDGEYNANIKYLTMLAYFVAATYVQLVVFTVFGGAKEDMQQQQQQQASSEQ